MVKNYNNTNLDFGGNCTMRLNNVRKMCKRGAALALAGAVSMACFGTNAMAASTVNGNLNGYGCHGSVSKDSNSAWATTTFSLPNSSTIKVSATVYYWWKDKYYKTNATASNTVGGACAKAQKLIGGSDVIGGKGTHYVSYDIYRWGTAVTTTGKTPSNAITK